MTSTKDKEKMKYRPYSLRELAEIYGVCPRTLKMWMQPFKSDIGKRKGRFYTIPQVKIIFDKLSYPSIID